MPRASGTVPLDADIRCLCCGYLLRGVSARCPECGTPFNPADYENTFIAQWPRLAALFLLGKVGFAALRVYEHVRGNEWATGRPPDTLDSWLYRGAALATVGLGAAAAWGLRHGRDWGRRVAILLMGVLAGVGATETVLRHFANQRYIANLPIEFTSELRDLLRRREWRNCIVDGAAAVLPAGLLGAFLASGMRRRSLGRPPSAYQPPLPLARYGPRNDWVGLMGVLLVGLALAEMPQLVRTWPNLIRPGGTWEASTNLIGRINWLLPQYRAEFTFVWGLAGAVVVWMRPGTARWFTLGLVAVVVGEQAFTITVTMTGAGQTPRGPWGGWLALGQHTMWAIQDAMVPVAVHVFARGRRGSGCVQPDSPLG